MTATILTVTATFADGISRRVALTSSRNHAVSAWAQYRRRDFPAHITDDQGDDVSPQDF